MTFKYASEIQRLLLGALALLSGSLKMFAVGIDNIAGMIASFGLPAAMPLAWLLIFVEIAFGLAILFAWKLEWTPLPQAAILIVASFFVFLPQAQFQQVVIHLVLAAGYFLLAANARLGPGKLTQPRRPGSR